jgi:hypothetical protein
MARLRRHPRVVFHFTPTSCLRLDTVETVSAKLITRHPRVVFHFTPTFGPPSIGGYRALATIHRQSLLSSPW